MKFPVRILLHAPGIHVGGGLHLLESLLEPNSASFEWAQLDKRIQSKGLLTEKVAILWVKKSIWSRLWAEWQLYRRCAVGDTVLCFHGLPPFFHLRGHVVVFVQNNQVSLCQSNVFTIILNPMLIKFVRIVGGTKKKDLRLNQKVINVQGV